MIFTFLNKKTPPIQKQIEDYYAWKAVRSSTAYSHKEILLEFVKRYEFLDVRDFVIEKVILFLKSQPTLYRLTASEIAFREFLRYNLMQGITCLPAWSVQVESPQLPLHEMLAMHRRPNIKMAKEVQRLYNPGKGMTFRRLQALLEKRDQRRYHLKTLHFWAHYPLNGVIPTH